MAQDESVVLSTKWQEGKKQEQQQRQPMEHVRTRVWWRTRKGRGEDDKDVTARLKVGRKSARRGV